MPKRNHTECLFDILQSGGNDIDYQQICSEIACHDSRIAAALLLVDIASALCKAVELDCAQMSYEHGKEGGRSSGDVAKDHYCSKYWYAADGYKMAAIRDALKLARARAAEIEDDRIKIHAFYGGLMTEKEADAAIANI